MNHGSSLLLIINYSPMNLNMFVSGIGKLKTKNYEFLLVYSVEQQCSANDPKNIAKEEHQYLLTIHTKQYSLMK